MNGKRVHVGKLASKLGPELHTLVRIRPSRHVADASTALAQGGEEGERGGGVVAACARRPIDRWVGGLRSRCGTGGGTEGGQVGTVLDSQLQGPANG